MTILKQTDQPKILFLLGDAVFPINNGGRMRTLNFIRALKDHSQLSVLFLENHTNFEKDNPEYESIFKTYTRAFSDQRCKSRSKWSRITDLLQGIPWEIEKMHRPDFANKLADILQKQQQSFDYIFVRYIYQAQYLRAHFKNLKAKIILDLDDIETKKIRYIMELEGVKSGYDQWRQTVNIAIFERFYKTILRHVDTALVCSKDDQDYVLNHGWHQRVEILPNAIDMSRYDIDEPNCEQDVFLFCGDLGYDPNHDAILWFVDKVWPLICQKHPTAHLSLVGKTPRPAVAALDRQPSITVSANVPDVMKYYQKARVVIVPIRFGAGTRIKILEAGACRLPVVSTTLGAEGLGVINEEHYLLADQPEDFARQCLRLLTDQNLSRRLVKQNYEFVRQNFDAQSIAHRIRELFHIQIKQDGAAK